jgi:cysteine dioxygenase
MKSIKSVEELTTVLNTTAVKDFASVIKRVHIDIEDLESYMTWKEACYTRNCLGKTDDYELILLCWDKGVETPIHGHGGEDCWVYQMEGVVQEIRFEENENEELIEKQRITLEPGKLTYMNDEMGYHTIKNIGLSRAITLHVYASPIHSCKVYDDDKGTFELKELSYHSYKGNSLTPSV